MAAPSKKETGQRGERLAAHFLRSRGYTILETNFRVREGELDIVARKEEFLVFVEVRTRRGTALGTPEESVTPRKKEKLIALAHTYLEAHPAPEQPWRIDVVAVELGPGSNTKIRLIENAVD